MSVRLRFAVDREPAITERAKFWLLVKGIRVATMIPVCYMTSCRDYPKGA